MSFDYLALSNAADKIITNFGSPVTITTKGNAAYDVDTGTVVSTDTTETAYGVVTNYDKKEIDGSIIQMGDKRLLLSSTGITTVKPNAKATVDGNTYVIVSVNETRPANVTLVYELQVRGV